MNNGLTTALTIVAAVGCALTGGVLFGFSTLVMPALRRLPPLQGLTTMQGINAAAITPLFLGALFVPALGCLALAADALLDLGEDNAGLLLAGSLLYLLGAILVTIAYHVPRNERLAGVDPADADAPTHWMRYAAGWTTWNHLRAAASLAAAAVLAVSLG